MAAALGCQLILYNIHLLHHRHDLKLPRFRGSHRVLGSYGKTEDAGQKYWVTDVLTQSLGKQLLGSEQWQCASRTHGYLCFDKGPSCISNFTDKSINHLDYPGFVKVPKSVQFS